MKPAPTRIDVARVDRERGRSNVRPPRRDRCLLQCSRHPWTSILPALQQHRHLRLNQRPPEPIERRRRLPDQHDRADHHGRRNGRRRSRSPGAMPMPRPIRGRPARAAVAFRNGRCYKGRKPPNQTGTRARGVSGGSGMRSVRGGARVTEVTDSASAGHGRSGCSCRPEAWTRKLPADAAGSAA